MGRGAALSAAAALALSCGGSDFTSSLPDGAVVAGAAAALTRALSRLERLELAPLGREAIELKNRLSDCEAFLGSSDAGEVTEVFRSIRCVSPTEIPASVRTLRGDADLALVLRFSDRGALAGAARIDEHGAVVFDARFDIDGEGLASFLLPDDELPGPPKLNSDSALMQGRFRPEAGLNIAALVPEGGQGADLFRLKSELFAGAVLDGSVEFAVYLPENGRQMPPTALGMGFRFRAPAVAAMEKFVTDLRATWPVIPEPLEVGGHDGQCFGNLKILPEFAPCYVATADSLVIGWDRDSIEHALASGKAAAADERGGLVVHLDRFHEADRMLRERISVASQAKGLDYAWDRIVARTSAEDGAYKFHFELQVGGDS